MFQACRAKVKMMNGGDKPNTVWRGCWHSACTMVLPDNARHVQIRSTDNICSYCVNYIHWLLDVVKLQSRHLNSSI
ncbi:hypothetical protein J6590_096289 [Homalodisca vitripennis]|nr:hypothetical protein J6590_096289 [Homalodisca vitripennis]